MPDFRYKKLCFTCSTPIQSNRFDKVYCSEPCCTYSTRARLKHAPELTTREWIRLIEKGLLEKPLEELKHPIKHHPINNLVPKLKELQDQIKALLPERVAL